MGRVQAKFADFSGADLTNADLRRANLWGVNLSQATVAHPDHEPLRFVGTNLQMATWTDGRKCQRGSVGRCIWEAP